ncbi:MAG: fructosamine kinase family protein [Pseudomonadota bacterium]
MSRSSDLAELSLTQAIAKYAGENTLISDSMSLSGGTINQAYRVSLASGEVCFVKLANSTGIYPGMFEAEADALKLISQSETIQVPEVLFVDAECIIQAYFEQGKKGANWHEEIGRQLALMHRAIQADVFGFSRNNFLGTSKQINRQRDSWLIFWQENRLQPQIDYLASALGMGDSLVIALERLCSRLPIYLGDTTEPAVFVHGDLWSGNAAADSRGAPIIFDPAGYFACREVEFGMMRLFGGFGLTTEAAYEELWPFQAGSEERIEIYRLYHIVNHLIIFGSSYYQDAKTVVSKLL